LLFSWVFGNLQIRVRSGEGWKGPWEKTGGKINNYSPLALEGRRA
jgi:hypothetical protein